MTLKALIWSDLRAFGRAYDPRKPAFWRFLIKQSFFHAALFGVIWYRYGHWAFCICKVPVWRHLHALNYLLWLPLLHALTGVDIAYEAEIGPGLVMGHGHQVIGAIQAGANLFVHDGVLVGAVNERYPTLGDDVTLGARAVIIGPVRLGDGCRIGAGAVVVKDVPAGATAVGNPARVILKAVPSAASSV